MKFDRLLPTDLFWGLVWTCKVLFCLLPFGLTRTAAEAHTSIWSAYGGTVLGGNTTSTTSFTSSSEGGCHRRADCTDCCSLAVSRSRCAAFLQYYLSTFLWLLTAYIFIADTLGWYNVRAATQHSEPCETGVRVRADKLVSATPDHTRFLGWYPTSDQGHG
jgi:hypothetical protein